MTDAIVEVRDDQWLDIQIGNRSIHCQYATSENRCYTIAFCDGDPAAGTWGHRASGGGYYFLIQSARILTRSMIERPNDGKVANNGSFIFNDWLFNTDSRSVGYAFKQDGDQLLSQEFSANLHRNAISATGRFALFQTANSDFTDSNKLFFFDIVSSTLLWEKTCDFEWPDTYHIAEERCQIDIYYPHMGYFSLDWEGNLIDRRSYDLQFIKSLTGNRTVYECMKRLTSPTHTALIDLLKKGINDAATSRNTKAEGYKFLGELFESQDIKFTSECYEWALHYNPKIGLKKKLSALQQQLATKGRQP